MKNFKRILKPNQEQLKKIVSKYLKAKEYKPVIGDGFVYAKGEIPIMLVAHLDTVHKYSPREIFYDNEQDVMWSPQGIGGDDRCGVYAILKILETHKPYVCFTEDEEIGCVGAEKFVNTIIAPNEIKFVIEIDRRGKDDCVFYDCGNEAFKEYIESFGFKTKIGTFSDIVEISDEWEVASVNVSSGYYNEHTNQEYIKINELKDTIEKVKSILDDAENVGYFEYNKKTYQYDDYYQPYNKGNNLTKIEKGVYLDTKTGEIVELEDDIETDDDKLD